VLVIEIEATLTAILKKYRENQYFETFIILGKNDKKNWEVNCDIFKPIKCLEKKNSRK